MLYPQSNALRSSLDLSGFWRFIPDPDDIGLDEGWDSGLPDDSSMLIAVPGAWNEQLAERGLFNYIGTGWYETSVTLPESDGQRRVFLYVCAADHRAEVWCNGIHVGRHDGGYLPFQVEMTEAWKPGGSNVIVLSVDNRLSMTSLPQDVDPTAAPYSDPSYDRRHLFPPTRFDFFPYGGLTRPAFITTTGPSRITSIRIETTLTGAVSIRVATDGEARCVSCRILDGRGRPVSDRTQSPIEHDIAITDISVDRPRLWSPANPHLYTAEVELVDTDGRILDTYRENFGIREIRVDGDRLLLNDEPLFLTGFGKHEDLPIVGRGQFRAGWLRDFELLRWTGANSFRTSHYPYDEEIVRLADRLGFLVIDEVPAVSLGFLSDRLEDLNPLLEHHKRMLSELIARDRNHPSVIAWSTVNEPNLWAEPNYDVEAGRRYFDLVANHVRSLDATRPVMAITIPALGADDPALESCDIIGINRYYGWYTEPADLAYASNRLAAELDAIHQKWGRPIVVTEFGADTVAGEHATTAQMFTEEFQEAFLTAYCDVIESRPFCVGEHVWNFADFRTPQHFRRVVLNLKGVFDRSRNPKRAAFVLRDRWRRLSRVAEAHRPEPGPDGTPIPDLKHPVTWRH